MLSTGLWLGLNGAAYGDIDPPGRKFDEATLANVRTIRYSDPDSALRLLGEYYAHAVREKSDPDALNILPEMAFVYGNKAQYREAFDQSWKALLLADRIGNNELKADVYLDIGRRYSYFKRKKEALGYFNTSLKINRELVNRGKLDKSSLMRNFYALAATYREWDDPAQAERYLDSSPVYYKDNVGAIKSISVSNTQNWKEFDARFVSVNSEFYERLHARFPNLTPGDQKLCALVKLNFSSKDIARLLGISVGSAHTTRHRLRKKLGLSREENLTEFIATL